MWAVYMVLLFRDGRRDGAAAGLRCYRPLLYCGPLAWTANYFSSVHRYVAHEILPYRINHNSAPVEVRERLAIPDSRLPDAMRRLTDRPDVEEGIIFSTCNRVEVFTRSADIVPDLREFIHDTLDWTALL